VVFVKVDAVDGDGSRAAPFGSLAEVDFSRLGPGTTVALSKGDHLGAMSLHSSFTLRGTCASQTSIREPDRGPEAVVTVHRTGPGLPAVVLENLHIRDSPRVGLEVGSGARVSLEGVWVSNVGTYGVRANDGAQFEARSLLIDSIAPAPTGESGLGIQGLEGSTIKVTRAVVRKARTVGVETLGVGSQLELRDVAILDTREELSSGEAGIGLTVLQGATAHVRRGLLERNRTFGISIQSDAVAVANDVVVRDTLWQPSNQAGGMGVAVGEGAGAELQGVLLERNQDAGILMPSSNGSLRLTDGVVRDTLPRRRDSAFGRGVDMDEGAVADLLRVVIERNHDAGVYLGGGSQATLARILIRDQLPYQKEGDSKGRFGVGLDVLGGSRANLREVAFVRNRERGGVLAAGEGSHVEARDIYVADTLPNQRGQFGRGIEAFRGGTLQVRRSAVLRTHSSGVFSSVGARLIASDLLVADIRSEVESGEFGRGVIMQQNSAARLHRIRVHNSRGSAVAIVTTSSATIEDALISDTRYEDCFDSGTCLDVADPAAGIFLAAGSTLSIERSRVEGVGRCALRFQTEWNLTFDSLRLQDSPCGVCTGPTTELSELEALSLDGNEKQVCIDDLPPPERPD
jgi:hypothetical protein